jgi:hypothetical protein
MGLVSSMQPDKAPAAYRWPEGPAEFDFAVQVGTHIVAEKAATRSLLGSVEVKCRP